MFMICFDYVIFPNVSVCVLSFSKAVYLFILYGFSNSILLHVDHIIQSCPISTIKKADYLKTIHFKQFKS